MDHLFDFKIDEKRFDILREEFIRSLKNFKAEQPYQHAIYYLALILTENAWANSELLDAMECGLTVFTLKKLYTLYNTTFFSIYIVVTYERVVNFAREFFQRLHTECFIYGNVTKAQALDIAGRVNKRLEKTNSIVLPLLARQMLKKREYKLCSGEWTVQDILRKLYIVAYCLYRRQLFV